MPLSSLPRAGVLRAVAVVVITATITVAAACSDEDTVDTVPPPRPTQTGTADGAPVVPEPSGTDVVRPTQPPPFTVRT